MERLNVEGKEVREVFMLALSEKKKDNWSGHARKRILFAD